MSAEALATELTAMPVAPAAGDTTAATPAPVDAPEAAPKTPAKPADEPERAVEERPAAARTSGAQASGVQTSGTRTGTRTDDAQRGDAPASGAQRGGAQAVDARSAAQTTDAQKHDDARQDSAQRDDAQAADAQAPEEPSVGAPVRHSGDRIGRRYRLEECTTSNEVFSSWRAVDEKLRRAVGIHLISAEHPRAKRVQAAARQAALLGDPRFVQVLDAVEDDDIVYVVREWLPDATGLDTMLLSEPLESYEAYQLVRQLADALTAAHRRGLAHLRLTPASVLRTDSGQYRIDGMAVNAALRGIEAEDKADAAQRDTRAIGALLFAALTHRWPYPEGAHGLQGLPRDLGTVPAERVKAGVHRGLSELTARSLCTPPGGKLAPVTTPEELAKAITEMPKVRQPEPEPLILPSYPGNRDTARRSGTLSPAPAATTNTPRPPQTPKAPSAPQPALPGRSGRALKWAVSLVVLGAIGLASWGTAEALMSHNNTGSTNTQLSQGQGNNGGQQPAQGNSGRELKTFPISSDAEFSPLDAPIAANKAALAIDNKPDTAWITSFYTSYPNFGNLTQRKDGSGIVVDLGSVQSVSEVKVLLPIAGQTQEILAAPADAAGPGDAPTDLSGFTQRISNDALLPGTSLDSGVLAKPVRTRYVLIHVTSLPADPSDPAGYRGGISEIQVLG